MNEREHKNHDLHDYPIHCKLGRHKLYCCLVSPDVFTISFETTFCLEVLPISQFGKTTISSRQVLYGICYWISVFVEEL